MAEGGGRLGSRLGSAVGKGESALGVGLSSGASDREAGAQPQRALRMTPSQNLFMLIDAPRFCRFCRFCRPQRRIFGQAG